MEESRTLPADMVASLDRVEHCRQTQKGGGPESVGCSPGRPARSPLPLRQRRPQDLRHESTRLRNPGPGAGAPSAWVRVRPGTAREAGWRHVRVPAGEGLRSRLLGGFR